MKLYLTKNAGRGEWSNMVGNSVLAANWQQSKSISTFLEDHTKDKMRRLERDARLVVPVQLIGITILIICYNYVMQHPDEEEHYILFAAYTLAIMYVLTGIILYRREGRQHSARVQNRQS